MKKLTTTLVFLLSILLPNMLHAQEGAYSEESITIDGNQRNYTVYVPDGYTGENSAGLVFNFHGYTGTVDDQISRTKMDIHADSLNYIVVYPEGLNVNRASNVLPSFVPSSGSGWNIPGFTINTENDDLEFIDSLITSLQLDYNIDSERVHSTGLSLGGYMALYVATQLPDRIASFASVAGHMTETVFNSLELESAPAALLIHGTEDVLTFYEGKSNVYKSVVSTAEYFAQINNCNETAAEEQVIDKSTADGTTVTKFEYAECNTGKAVELYRVNNGGHRWPGSGIVEPAGLGLNSQDINSSRLVLEFFNKYPNVVVSNEEETDIPETTTLEQNYPNPFNPSTNISFTLPQAGNVNLRVYNMLGQEVANLVNERKVAGSHTVNFDASGLASGVYIYQLVSGDIVQTKKMLLIK